jgi:hypothetical protein
LRTAAVLKVRRGATTVSARKLTPARAAVSMVERAKRDMLNFLVIPPNQKPGTPQFGYLE